MSGWGPGDWDRAYGAADLSWGVEPHPELAAAVWLARHGWDVTAVDFSPVAVDRGRRLAEHHGVSVHWEVADVVGWEPLGAVDLAVVMYLHVQPVDLAIVLARAAGSLAPGGTLFVLGWDSANASNGTGGPRPAELLLSVDELRRAAAGLDVVRAERVPQMDSDRAVDALLVARRR